MNWNKSYRILEMLKKSPLRDAFKIGNNFKITSQKRYQLLLTITVMLVLMFVFYAFSHQAPDYTDAVVIDYNSFVEDIVRESPDANGYYFVTTVIDGDTFYVDDNGTAESVRLIGIDTPEIAKQKSEIQEGALEASNFMKDLVEGKWVYLEADESQGDRDQYGRLLRYAFLEDGTHINLLLLKEDLAVEYTFDKPYKYQEEFQKEQNENIK
ncbi:MAG: thermonuclease family protein [bacterium]